MQSAIQVAPVSKKVVWTGRIISWLPAVFLLSSGVNMLLKGSDVIQGLARVGFPESRALGIGIVNIISVVLYLIPATSVLGAILLTGYVGGAIAAHVRVGEPQMFVPIVLGVLIWLGLYLRDERLRSLIPTRK
jgi:DoxX-like family